MTTKPNDRTAAAVDPSPAHVAAVASRLVRAHAVRQRFEPFAVRERVATLPLAYAVQREHVALQAAARGVQRAGYKIGLTSPAMQAMCGIDTPVAGVVFSDRVHASGVRLDRSHYGRFGIEFEIAVRLGHDLRPAGETPISVDDVARAVDAVAPAVEIVDDRHCDYATLDVCSLVADNAWNAGIVLGAFQSHWPELSQVQGTVRVDGGAVLDSGQGSAVLGHPLRPVVWLAHHLAAQGTALCAGDIVMTGSMVTTKFPEGPGVWRFEVSGLGAVELTVVA